MDLLSQFITHMVALARSLAQSHALTHKHSLTHTHPHSLVVAVQVRAREEELLNLTSLHTATKESADKRIAALEARVSKLLEANRCVRYDLDDQDKGSYTEPRRVTQPHTTLHHSSQPRPARNDSSLNEPHL